MTVHRGLRFRKKCRPDFRVYSALGMQVLQHKACTTDIGNLRIFGDFVFSQLAAVGLKFFWTEPCIPATGAVSERMKAG